MSRAMLWACCCLVVWIGVSLLTWRGSPRFRALYPQFRSGPFWACFSQTGLAWFSQPFSQVSKALFGPRFGAESWQVYAIAAAVLLGGFFLVQVVIPQTRRSIIAFDQHLMGKPVTGRLRPEPESR